VKWFNQAGLWFPLEHRVRPEIPAKPGTPSDYRNYKSLRLNSGIESLPIRYHCLERAIMNRREALEAIQRALACRYKTLRCILTNGSTLNGEASAESLFDAAAAASARKIHCQLIQAQTIELEKLEAALKRCRAGQYGVCEVCGAEIHIPRLNALPYTTKCICCQRKAEREAQDAIERNGQ
jgi:DnaK suppressor protein